MKKKRYWFQYSRNSRMLIYRMNIITICPICEGEIHRYSREYLHCTNNHKCDINKYSS